MHSLFLSLHAHGLGLGEILDIWANPINFFSSSVSCGMSGNR